MTADSLPHSARIDRLLIVRLSAMGDIIHTLPAATALRHAFPEAKIGWIVEERWAELLCSLQTPRSGPRSPGRPLVDHVHIVNTKQWRSSALSSRSWEQIAAGLSELRGQRYGLAVDFQGAVRSAVLARWSGAQMIYGARQPRENAASMFYTRQVMPHGTHVVEQYLAIAKAVAGHPLELPNIQFPCDSAVDLACERMLSESGIQDFVLLNPGAGWGAKQWPVDRYGEVAKHLGVEGLRSLINYGPGEEALARAVEASSGGAAKAIASSLPQLISLTRRARLFIGGDTGPLHLAAALRIPVVGIYGPTSPVRNGPFGTRSFVLRNPASRTSHSHRSEPEQGLLEISPQDVVTAALKLLGQSRG